MTEHHPSPPDEPRVPASLQTELARLAGAPAGLEQFDAAGIARAHFASVRRQRRLRWVSAAVAAGLALGAFVTIQIQLSSRTPVVGLPALAGDVNRDGVVDMLDALMLATRVAKGDPDPAWDLNRDQRVDRADADAIARLAVDLKGGRL